MGRPLAAFLGFHQIVFERMMNRPRDTDLHPGVWIRKLDRAGAGLSREIVLWRLNRIVSTYFVFDEPDEHLDSRLELLNRLIDLQSEGVVADDALSEVFDAPMLKLWGACFGQFRESLRFEVIFQVGDEGRIVVSDAPESSEPSPSMELPPTLEDAMRSCSKVIDAFGVERLASYFPEGAAGLKSARFDWQDKNHVVVTFT